MCNQVTLDTKSSSATPTKTKAQRNKREIKNLSSSSGLIWDPSLNLGSSYTAKLLSMLKVAQQSL
jgi:hypothetical protein